MTMILNKSTLPYLLLALGVMSVGLCHVLDLVFFNIGIFYIFPFFAAIALMLTVYNLIRATDSRARRQTIFSLIWQLVFCLLFLGLGIYLLNSIDLF